MNQAGNKTHNARGNAHAHQVFDGKRMRKSVQRRTVEYGASIARWFEIRSWYQDKRGQLVLQPETSFGIEFIPPFNISHNPGNAVTTKFVHNSANKVRCPVNVAKWTPDGRRLITGTSSGEFTLWNGLTFNFETILQAHDTQVRAMEWSHNANWMITADQTGFIKYWQSNMNNLKVLDAHREAVRGLSFSPTDAKFASCSDDGTIKVWNFGTAEEEKSMTGHGWDVKCLDWHPTKALLASGSKDNLVKLWDPKVGKSITTLHGHKSTIFSVQWNRNGVWLATASRDQLIKIFDLRVMKELYTYRGHEKEVASLSWHPHHECLLASGGADGSILFWNIGNENSIDGIKAAHEAWVWALDWHPMGHILVSGSYDHNTRFWTRSRPGDIYMGHDAKNHGIVTNYIPAASTAKNRERAFNQQPYDDMAFNSTNSNGLSAYSNPMPGLSIPGLPNLPEGTNLSSKPSNPKSISNPNSPANLADEEFIYGPSDNHYLPPGLKPKD